MNEEGEREEFGEGENCVKAKTEEKSLAAPAKILKLSNSVFLA